jgi:hypothetical protein
LAAAANDNGATVAVAAALAMVVVAAAVAAAAMVVVVVWSTPASRMHVWSSSASSCSSCDSFRPHLVRLLHWKWHTRAANKSSRTLSPSPPTTWIPGKSAANSALPPAWSQWLCVVRMWRTSSPSFFTTAAILAASTGSITAASLLALSNSTYM